MDRRESTVRVEMMESRDLREFAEPRETWARSAPRETKARVARLAVKVCWAHRERRVPSAVWVSRARREAVAHQECLDRAGW